MRGERDRGAGGPPAGVAFPVMADFAALDEFGQIGGNHHVAAVRAVRRLGEGADAREPGRVDMKLHGLRPPLSSKFFSSMVLLRTMPTRITGHRGEGETIW